MKIKKITAENTKQALHKTKEVLGEDAIILDVQEKVDQLTKKKFVVVSAALDEEYQNEKDLWSSDKNRFSNNEQKKNKKELNIAFDDQEIGYTYSPHAARNQVPKQDLLASPTSSTFSELQEVREQLNSLSTLLQGNGYPELSPPFLENYVKLINAGVNKQIALQMIKNVEDRISREASGSRKFIQKEISLGLEYFVNRFKYSPNNLDKYPEIKIMVGPTGVGKTTCIAKLSAIDKVYQKQKVGLISIDTYRIAAIEQLQTYANITRVPLQVVYDPSEMKEALFNLSDCDVIYIDTPGRSHKNTDALKDMSKYFRSCPNPDIHLVLSLTSKEEDMKEIVDRFSIFPIKQLLFTKLDETNTIGSIFGVINRAKKPISYFSTGQNVPDDIMKPQKDSISKMLLGERI
jgi:flagellar biosynthesis protein FlhF